MLRHFTKIVTVANLVAVVAVVGCSNAGNKPVAQNNSSGQTMVQNKTGEEHAHKPSAHGGIVVSIGRDSYHAEAVFEKGGTLRLYMLGQDETKVLEVESQTLT